MDNMDIVDVVETQLPFLRRYARAVTGSRSEGDSHVEAVLLSILNKGGGHATRHDLFTELDRHLVNASASQNTETAKERPLLSMRADTRRALLLTAMEQFSAGETAQIMSRSEDDIAQLLIDAERELKSILKCRVMIIEDEPLIAAGLSQIASSLGHKVVGVAVTKGSAVKLASAETPDLVLADVKLADDTLGTDAIAEIQQERDVQVIYITAYPEKLLTGAGAEPTYLITKPFRATMVKAVISQALISRI